MMAHLIAIVVFVLPPAVKTLAILGFVYGIIQILKQSPVLAPYIKGWVAVALNATLSALGLLLAIPPAQLYDPTTLGVTFTTWLGIVLGAAGIHGTIKSFSQPTVLAIPSAGGTAVNVPAMVVPVDPRARPVAKP
jgi:hypothetical protein